MPELRRERSAKHMQMRKGDHLSNLAYNVLINTHQLKPHPKNLEIYGTEEIDVVLLDSIKQTGVLTPLLVTSDNEILSGHRRWIHAKALGIERLPCQVFDSSDETEKIKLLLSSNIQRKKTESQYQKEADEWEIIIRAENAQKQKDASEYGTLGGRGNKREEDHQDENPCANIGTRVFSPDENKTRNKLPIQVGYDKGKTTFSKARAVYTAAKEGDETAKDLMKKVDEGTLTVNSAFNQLKQKQQELEPKPELELPEGKYRCLVIDPPWDVKKIIRDERPNQAEFDYKTMSDEEIEQLQVEDLADDNCHLYLWTTHKKLPVALKLAEKWGFKYQCLMTWVKNVGFTPFSWMYSTEHVLFCKKGSLEVERKGLRLDFTGKVREHSRKPDEFYKLVLEATPGPRLELFSREIREGFEQWGNETDKFSDEVDDGIVA